MKLSITSGAVCGVRENGQVRFLPHLGIEQCARAGFDRMEYNLLAGPTADRLMARGNWREELFRLRQTLDENAMIVPYTHDAWFMMAQTVDASDVAFKEEMVRRSVEATCILGGKRMVVHAQSIYDSEGYNESKTWEYNRAFLSEIGELAARDGIGLDVENLFPVAGMIEFSSRAEDLMNLMQTINDPTMGICWDLGHANMAKVDHMQALETVAPWLRLIHAADNKATVDEHNIPGYGTVPWDAVMSKLKSIGYAGDLNLSVRTFAYPSIPKQRVRALEMLLGIGNDLIDMFDKA